MATTRSCSSSHWTTSQSSRNPYAAGDGQRVVDISKCPSLLVAITYSKRIHFGFRKMQRCMRIYKKAVKMDRGSINQSCGWLQLVRKTLFPVSDTTSVPLFCFNSLAFHWQQSSESKRYMTYGTSVRPTAHEMDCFACRTVISVKVGRTPSDMRLPLTNVRLFYLIHTEVTRKVLIFI